MGFYDAFFGSEQSQYTAYAIVAAIIAICITILLTATDVPISNRLLIVFFVIISLIPSVFLTLFELTCIVTGGTEPNHWWCHAFAWILAAFIIIYCIFIVIISLISLFTYNNAIDNVKINEDNNRLSPEVSNDYAKKIIQNDEIKTKQIEKFYQDELSNNGVFGMMNNNSPYPTNTEPKKEESSTETFQLNNKDTGHSNLSNMFSSLNSEETQQPKTFDEVLRQTPPTSTTTSSSTYPQPPTSKDEPVGVSGVGKATFSNYTGGAGLDDMYSNDNFAFIN